MDGVKPTHVDLGDCVVCLDEVLWARRWAYGLDSTSDFDVGFRNGDKIVIKYHTYKSESCSSNYDKLLAAMRKAGMLAGATT